MKKLALLFVVLVTACAPTSPRRSAPRETAPDIRSLIETALIPAADEEGASSSPATLAERMEHYGVPAVSVAFIDGAEIAWADAWGLADVESERAATSETLFQAASISKPVAATGALKLVDDGALDLDGAVNEKLASWQIPVNEFNAQSAVSLRRLVTHTAGMTVHGFPGYERTDALPTTIDVLDGAGNTAEIRVDTEPGTLWRYSGGGYTVMQQLVIDVTGESYPEFLRRVVLEPLGMTHSTYEQPLPESLWGDAASGYRPGGDKVGGDWHVYPEMAAAGLWTTPTDLALWAIALQKAHVAGLVDEGRDAWIPRDIAPAPHPVLSPAMVAAMLTPGMNDQGLGPRVNTEVTNFGHGGANEGFRCFLTAYLDSGQGIAIMTNSDRGADLYGEILATVAAALDWAEFR